MNDEQLSRINSGVIDVFGSLEETQRFLDEPRMAFDGQWPSELLDTSEGPKLVEAHLTRLVRGVYT